MTVWKLDPDELTSVMKSGIVALCIMSNGSMPPVFVGSAESAAECFVQNKEETNGKDGGGGSAAV